MERRVSISLYTRILLIMAFKCTDLLKGKHWSVSAVVPKEYCSFRKSCSGTGTGWISMESFQPPFQLCDLSFTWKSNAAPNV
jgi:hypothetical protein